MVAGRSPRRKNATRLWRRTLRSGSHPRDLVPLRSVPTLRVAAPNLGRYGDVGGDVGETWGDHPVTGFSALPASPMHPPHSIPLPEIFADAHLHDFVAPVPRTRPPAAQTSEIRVTYIRASPPRPRLRPSSACRPMGVVFARIYHLALHHPCTCPTPEQAAKIAPTCTTVRPHSVYAALLVPKVHGVVPRAATQPYRHERRLMRRKTRSPHPDLTPTQTAR